MTSKLGILVVGQSPRPEIDAQFTSLLPGVELVQRGCLDGLSRDEILELAPGPNDKMLFTRLPDGTGVRLSKSAVIEHGAAQLDRIESLGAAAVIVLCTGSFPMWAGRRVLFPSRILRHFVLGLRQGGKLGVLTPLEDQLNDANARWSECGFDVTGVALSPNASEDEALSAGHSLAKATPDLLVFDCASYTSQTKRFVCGEAGTPGVLAATAIARVAAELLDR